MNCSEKIKQYHKEYYQKNKIKWQTLYKVPPSVSREASKKYYRKHRKRALRIGRNSNLKYWYGITIDDYDKMFEKQNGVCYICNNPETKHNQYGLCRLCVDHNHITKKVRGLLCWSCNTKLGWFEKYKDNILEYLLYELLKEKK